MQNTISNTILSFWHNMPRVKLTPSGWYSGNAVCCHHNGTTHDTRGRGGMILHQDGGLSYSCFNCGFSTTYKPSYKFSYKMKNFLSWLGLPESLIEQLYLESWKLSNGAEAAEIAEFGGAIPTFSSYDLPDDAQPIESYSDISQSLTTAIEYLYNRHLYLDDYPFYWSPSIPNRLIIPYYFNRNIVGYGMRLLNNDAKEKRYITHTQPNYVFNLDNQDYDKSFVLVMEGQLDAICLGGTAILGSSITDGHHILLQQLYRDIVLVPDRDVSGFRTIIQAMQYGWHISLPEWPDGVKDVNDAVIKLGRLATMYLITKNIYTHPMQIKQRAYELYRKFDLKGIAWPRE